MLKRDDKQAQEESPFKDPETNNTPPICWICQQPYYRTPGRWSKSGYMESKLCRRCYDDLRKKVVRQKKRARLRNASNTLTTIQWATILRASEGKCYYCHVFIGFQDLTMEHLKPIAMGGGTTYENVVPACLNCNLEKWVMRGRVEV